MKKNDKSLGFGLGVATIRDGLGWLRQAVRLVIFLAVCCSSQAWAAPVGFYRSFAGNLDFAATGGSLRAQSNAGNACALNASSTSPLAGIPAGATISAAYLYWAGSGSSVDSQVSFAAQPVTALRSFTESLVISGTSYSFFAGFADVTAIVAGIRNGNYSFSGLTVDNGGNYCASQAVVSGWGLVVVYSAASEPLRVLNIYDGLQAFRGESISLTPNNFQIPSSGINGRHGILTWEGDVENSTPLNGFNENLLFNGVALTDGLNPANNQFNSTINVIGSSNSYGVDFDVYDISSLLRAGDTSASAVYSSGADLVLLSLEVVSVSNVPVADLAVSLAASPLAVGALGSYSVTVVNQGPRADTSSVIRVQDTLPSGLSFVAGTGAGWSCSALGQDVTCSHSGGLAVGASLPPLAIQVAVAAAALPSVSNSVTVSGVGAAFDHQLANNTASLNTPVGVPDLSSSSKTVVDLNGADLEPGDKLRYSINLLESAGAEARDLSVVDQIPANVLGFTVISLPAGAADASTGMGTGANGTGLLSVSGIHLPANGNAQVVFEVTVAAVTPGTVISNTATVTNPNGPGATPVAADMTVSASTIPASGIKPLYLSTSPVGDLSRLQPPVQAAFDLAGAGTSRSWLLTPALQSDFRFDASGVVPVTLQLARSGGNTSRSISLLLDVIGPSSQVLGSVGPQVLTLSTAFREVEFSVAVPPNLTLLAGSRLRLQITNHTAQFNRYIRVLANNAGRYSAIALPAATVINVDSLGFYSAAYPAGSLLSGAAYGSTLFIRAGVSDPFGSFDINNALLTVLAPDGSPALSAAPMAVVFDSAAATRIYERSFTLPASGSAGFWTAQVTANEGAEDLVRHSRNAALAVAYPELLVVKTVVTSSDPVNGSSNPKAIPGATLLYSLQASNQGYGAADTVVVSDVLPAGTALFVGDLDGAGSPLVFEPGSSGLSYSFFGLASVTDSLEFSSGGAFNYVPSPDADGYDANVTALRIRPSGSFARAALPTSFTARFRVRLQ